MPSENRSEWSTVKVIVLCLLTSALAFYGGSRLDVLRVSSAQSAPTKPHPPKTEPPRAEQVKRDKAPQYFEVAQVIEGDVIKLEDGTEVNLIGVSCPKLHDADLLQVALAHEAVAFTTGAIAGKRVRLEYEPAHSLDGRGRTLAYIYLQDGTFLNAELIKHGYGSAFARYTYRFIDDFHRYEFEARNGKIGQWEERDAEAGQIENRYDDSIDTQSRSSGNAENATQEDFPSTNSLGPSSRARVAQPSVVATPTSEKNDLSFEQLSANTTIEPPKPAYTSPSYIFPSIAPTYKPIVAENGSTYGEISERTGRPKTVYVRSYTRRDGTYVRSHWRSAPR